MSRISLGALLAAAGLLLAAGPLRADQYRGNGNTGFDGTVGNGTLTLSDDGTNISGTLTVGGSMNDVLVLYIQTGPGGFTNTFGFNDQGDSCRQAISGVSASGRSLLTFASGFQPNYAIALAPAAAGTGGLWQLANGGNNSLVYLGSLNLAPLNNSGPYSFSFPAALIGMIPGVRSTIQVFGTYVRTYGSRSTEAIAGDLTGTQGWNPFTQTAYASYIFDADAVVVRLPLGIWTERLSSSPTERSGHTAVWTGSEMVVWGGNGDLNDGGRYNPAANAWMAVSTAGAPGAREAHSAVWTGSEMIVWGGWSNGAIVNDGGSYNLAANRWTALPTNGAPAARAWHTAIWTGRELIVWSGSGDKHDLNDGGRFNPEAKSWTALPTSGAPAARGYHTSVWTGSEMIVWGGSHWDGSPMLLNDGGRFNPTANTWMALPTTGAPIARAGHTTVWTGSEMIVWGGWDFLSQPFNDGGRYNPVANNWTAVPTNSAPAKRYEHTAVWTGSEMIVWGGYNGSPLNDGGRYDPTTNIWSAVVATGAPEARNSHTAVWTGSEMIVWGGSSWNGSSGASSAGGRYNPKADTWATMTTCGPVGRGLHTAVWTGSEMIIWGGVGHSSLANGGGRYNPVANTWTSVSTNGAPDARNAHTAVWSGNEMIIWGGTGHTPFSGYLKDGGRYNPIADRWTLLPINGAPAPRAKHTAVWTGSEMIIWGGFGDNSTCLNDGGRYDPVANSWRVLPTTGAPAAREGHSMLWAGNEVIVWGGYYYSGDYHDFNDGGRYDPVANSWTAVSTNGAPDARDGHTATWTGNEMIVWGGWNGSSGGLNSGGRYNPEGNSWTEVPSSGAPVARSYHTAVWTGSEMIIFGGYSNDGSLSDTWSYYPYAPAVRISRSSPTSTVVAWPVWSPTLRLCQTTNPVAGQWTTVTNAATQVGSENHVTVSPLSGSQFFRVEYP